MWGYGGHWAFWEVGLMWVGMIVFWALLVGAVYALVSTASRGTGTAAKIEDPQRVLDHRLAIGEIDTEEYRLRRELIKQSDHSLV